MINILLSTLEINNDNAYENLKEYIRPHSKILVMPFANFPYLMKENHFEELFHYDYGREFLDIAEQFQYYGVEKQDIWVISPNDSVEFVLDKMKRANVIYLSGGNPDNILSYMPQEIWEEMDNMEVIIGVSAGAMIQCNVYYMMKGYQDGSVPLIKKDRCELGMCYCFDVIVPHYDMNNEVLQKGINRYTGRRYNDLLLLQDGEGVVYKDSMQVKEW